MDRTNKARASAGKTSPKPNPFEGRRLFTAAQANQALPLVRAITSDLSRLSLEVSERRERLSCLHSGRDKSARDIYGDELAQIEDELEKDTERLLAYVEELRELGVDPKSGTEGLVDFPSMFDGRPIYLCWRLGEPYVSHWHEYEAGFLGRQPIPSGEFGDPRATVTTIANTDAADRSQPARGSRDFKADNN